MSNLTVNDLTLSELAPYISGKQFTGEVSIPRGSEEILKKFLTMLEEDDIAKECFNAYEYAKDFYKSMPDFAHFIPKELHQECFYAAKNGAMYKEIPALCVYMLRKAYEACNGIPNLIPKVIPSNVLNEWCKKGYFAGITLQDAICNVCNAKYKPLSKSYLKNVVDDFVEIYIESEDMVAAVPIKLAEQLDESSIKRIELTENGLAVDGVLLRTLCNYVGAINSYYDLRKLI